MLQMGLTSSIALVLHLGWSLNGISVQKLGKKKKLDQDVQGPEGLDLGETRLSFGAAEPMPARVQLGVNAGCQQVEFEGQD